MIRLQPLKGLAIRSARRLMQAAGVEARRYSNSPGRTFLGLTRRPIGTIIDVGANTGQFGRTARARFPNAHLVCFEPQHAPFGELSRWCTEDGNATPIQLGLSDSSGELTFYVHTDHDSSSSFLASTATSRSENPELGAQETLTVPVARIDDALAENGVELDGEVLVKIDVQGYEAFVVRGGPSLFARADACILEVCVDPFYEGQATFGELLGLMETHGLRYVGNLEQCRTRDGRISYFDAVFERANQA
jgi:FkbM family methyltransferase